jgi:hypothetical protein
MTDEHYEQICLTCNRAIKVNIVRKHYWNKFKRDGWYEYHTIPEELPHVHVIF